MDKIKYLFAIVAAFVMGGLLMAGPDEISEEIPYNIELGFGAIAFGCLMIAALYSARARNLVLALIFGAISIGLIMMAASGESETGQRILFGVLGAGTSLFFLYWLVTTFTGDDQAAEETDDRPSPD
jgi:peptidoglycan/LPS O-acetylase OafA/YrhL